MRTLIVLLTLASATAFAAEKNRLPGIRVGASVPDFELKDQNDKPVKLSTLLKKGPVAVVFHRSANW